MTSDTLYDGKQLDDWLTSQNASKFPGSVDYPQRYRTIRDHLCNNVYPQVDLATLWAEVRADRSPIYLTNHGADHVQDVISKATDLLRTSTYDHNHSFHPYEVFLLLTAILVHDVGNMFGREDHEKKCWRLMKDMGKGLFPDTAEKRIISKIAAAHCGIANPDYS